MPFYNINNRNYLIVFFIFALLEVVLCSGITYGWPSIVIVFKSENFYLDLCKKWHEDHNTTEAFSDEKLAGCPDQEVRMNLIFTVAVFSLCANKFPAGMFIDNFGPRRVRMIGGYYFCSIFSIK